MRSVNPATGELLREIAGHTHNDARGILASARAATLAWRDAAFATRSECVRALAEWLREDERRLATLMAMEMGKPVREGRQEVEKCAATCEHFAAHAEAALSPEPISTEMKRSYVAFRPLGVVLGIMPWNFPLWQVVRAAVPALMAGNGFVFKHASNVPQCALALDELFRKCPFPRGLVGAALVDGQTATDLIADPNVAAVTLTGSSEAGRAVAAAAGAALKKTVLELGGSDAYLVLEDADVDLAAEVCARARLINGGQSCLAAKRFIVHRSVRERFERAFVAKMAAVAVGDPLDERTEVGPLARADLRDSLHGAVTKTLSAGARLLLGGAIPERKGAWYPPTVLTDVPPRTPARDDEMFGPVGAIIPVDTEDEAIRVANESRYGLAAAVFTRDEERGARLAEMRLDCGSCAVNTNVRSDPRVPFGGVKASGYGRELSSFGLREFVNVKAISVR